MKADILRKVVSNQKNGKPEGMVCICSANPFVIEAAMKHAVETKKPILIEATANQVNQFGGYMGMRPADFKDYVYKIADQVQLDKKHVILGGDHLGPLVWKDEDADTAMEKAKALIKEFVEAGFTKIHVDTSMRLGSDDTDCRLSDEIIAERSAVLIEAAYACVKNNCMDDVVFVIGSEVPIPGGTTAEEEDELHITSVDELKQTIEVFNEVFTQHNIDNVWDDIIAVVVQPGVEFSDESIDKYDRQKAKDLVQYVRNNLDLVLEGHSTDYQTRGKLKQMREDGIAFLKVGPALTFALREALFALEMIEKELVKDRPLSGYMDCLENVMLENPKYWQKYYIGNEDELLLKRKYSFSDRARYYSNDSRIKASIQTLFDNLMHIKIPLTLLSQYMPEQYNRVKEGKLSISPVELTEDKIVSAIKDYGI